MLYGEISLHLVGIREKKGRAGEVQKSFSGNHERTLDAKWRVSLPPEFRRRGDEDDHCVLGRVPGSPCLGLWRKESFQAAYQRLQNKVRESGADQNLLRWFSGNGYEVKPDAQGRILVPEPLRSILDVDAEDPEARVFVAGVGQRIELWNAERWATHVGGAESYMDASSFDAEVGSEWL